MERNDDESELYKLLGRLTAGIPDRDTMKRFVSTLGRSIRVHRRGITLSGQGLADLLLKTAPHIPLRDKATLEQQYGGMSSTALAGHLIRASSRNSAAVGGVTGALASAGELAPPFWVMLPVEVIAETLIIAAIEMKLVAELHEVFGVPITGTDEERGLAILESWGMRKGVDINELRTQGAVSEALGKNAGSQIVQVVKRKLMVRAARNISSLAPLFIGAVAGAELNRRSTRDMGDAVVRDLGTRKGPSGTSGTTEPK